MVGHGQIEGTHTWWNWADCSRSVTLCPTRLMPIAAARPPRPAPMMATWSRGSVIIRAASLWGECDGRMGDAEE